MKRGILASFAAAALAATGVVGLVAQGQVANAATVANASSHVAANSALPPFAGHTYLITTDTGIVYRNTYSADGTTLHSVTIQGSGTGDSFDATLSTAQVGYNLYFVSWVEPTTVTVSQVINFNTHTLKLFATFADSTGARVGQLHSATISLVS